MFVIIGDKSRDQAIHSFGLLTHLLHVPSLPNYGAWNLVFVLKILRGFGNVDSNWFWEIYLLAKIFILCRL